MSSFTRKIELYTRDGHKTFYTLGKDKNAIEYYCGCLYANNVLLYCPGHYQHIKDLQNRLDAVKSNIMSGPVREKIKKWSCSHVNQFSTGSYCGICGRKISCQFI